jgi:transcriptional regulator with XRE-family HTH domain
MPGRRIPAPLSLVLTTLRSSRGWSQKALGEAAGLPHGFISDYEVGRRPLTRPKLEELAALLDYPAEAIDVQLFAARFLRDPEPPPGRPLSPTHSEMEQIEWSLARAVRLAVDVGREELVRGFREQGIREDRARAEELWEILKPHTPTDRWSLVGRSQELRSWALCERVCAESERAAAADAGRALDLADLALHIANHIRGPEGWRSRLEGYAWAFVGNARRVASDLPGADKAFGKAWELWKACPVEEQGPLMEWRLLDLEASLRRAQRRLPEALDLIDHALDRHTGEAPARIFLKRAFTLEQMGNHECAIETLQQAAPRVDSESEPRLLFALRFNLAVNLSQLGRHLEAAAILPEIRMLALRLENGPDQIRTLWLEGRIAAGLGQRKEAVSCMTKVRTEFAARGLSYDVALSTLELAVLYLDEGWMAKVKELARQMGPIFQAQGVHREALAALKIFRDAAEQEAATAELARRIVDYLCRARHDPGLKFQG